MPEIYFLLGFYVYFTSHDYVEPNSSDAMHVHISKTMDEHAVSSKVWITAKRELILANNDAKISGKILSNIAFFMEKDYFFNHFISEYKRTFDLSDEDLESYFYKNTENLPVIKPKFARDSLIQIRSKKHAK